MQMITYAPTWQARQCYWTSFFYFFYFLTNPTWPRDDTWALPIWDHKYSLWLYLPFLNQPAWLIRSLHPPQHSYSRLLQIRPSYVENANDSIVALVTLSQYATALAQQTYNYYPTRLNSLYLVHSRDRPAHLVKLVKYVHYLSGIDYAIGLLQHFW